MISLMKKCCCSIIFLFIFPLIVSCKSVKDEKAYFVRASYVSKFLNGRYFAVSLIFDDNNTAHFEKGYPIFEKYGIKATFNVSPGYNDFTEVYLPGYAKLKEIGCEIGAHGWYHINLTTLPPGEVELHMCKKPIELITNYFGERPISVSLNNAQANEQIEALFRKYYYVSKHVSLTNIERNGVAWLSTMSIEDDFIPALEKAQEEGRWLIIALHGIDDSGWNPISSSQLEQICKICVERDIYVDTGGVLGLYEYLYDNTYLKFPNDNEIVPCIKDNLKWPDGYEKIITVCIPSSEGIMNCNFDFSCNKHIVIGKYGVVVE